MTPSRSNLIHTVLRLADNSTVQITIAPCRNSSMWRVIEPPMHVIKKYQRKCKSSRCSHCGAHRSGKPRPGCTSTTHAAKYRRMMERRKARRAEA